MVIYFPNLIDLDLESFEKSNLDVSLEKVTNDTYLKVFDTNLIYTDKEIRPSNLNQLTSSIELNLDNENINFNSGMHYEKLKGLSSIDMSMCHIITFHLLIFMKINMVILIFHPMEITI